MVAACATSTGHAQRDPTAFAFHRNINRREVASLELAASESVAKPRVRDRSPLRFRDLNADHYVGCVLIGCRCLVATLPDYEDQKQRDDRGRRNAHAPVAPPHLAFFIRGRFPKNTH